MLASSYSSSSFANRDDLQHDVPPFDCQILGVSLDVGRQ